MKLLLLLSFGLLTLPGVSVASENGRHPFYAFHNGVRLSSVDQGAQLLQELGYDGIGSARLPSAENLDSFFEAHEKRDLKVFSFYTGAALTEDGATLPDGLLEMIPKLAGKEITFEFYVRGNRNTDLDQQAISVIRQIADLSDEVGGSVVLYPHAGFYIETLSDAVRLARKVDRDNVGVMFNLCHFLKVEPESDLRTTLESAGPLLQQVSVSGAEVGGTDWQALIQPLGRGSFDLTELLEILKDLDFAGPIGLQCYNVKGDSETFLGESIKAWKKM